MNIEHMKNDLLRTLDSIDKEKLSLYDLKTYAEIVRIAAEINSKDYMDKIIETMSTVSTGFNAPKIPIVADMK